MSALVASVADRVSESLGGAAIHAGGTTSLSEADDFAEPPGGWDDPWLVGMVHEQAASAADRRTRGAWYTPRPVVEGLVRATTSDLATDDLRLFVDPTCGGGAFLLAALDLLVERGVDPVEAVGRVAGMDVDPVAVDVCRRSIELWLLSRLGSSPGDGELALVDVRCGDALLDAPDRWPDRTIVVGNPPFASPLKSGTIEQAAAAVRERHAEVLGPYADLASIHLVHVLDGLGDGSTVTLVLPQSILSSRDTEGLRAWIDRLAPVQGLWACRELVFDASARACAPILRVGGGGRVDVRLYHGPTVERRGSRPRQRWGALAADALGAPSLPPLGPTRLGSLILGATAGFRDEYYALVAACREATPHTPPAAGSLGPGVGRIHTVGSIDPLTAAWGREPFRFGGRSWTRPVVDRDALSPRFQRWFDRLEQPKVLLATQAKLLEPFVDRSGSVVPATPLIAVLATPDDLDHVAAVLLAPPVVLWAWRRWFGTAMSVDAVKLAARQVGELPLPANRALWDRAAAVVAAAEGCAPPEAWDRSMEIAALMNQAYGADDDVFAWWLARRKSRPVAV